MKTNWRETVTNDLSYVNLKYDLSSLDSDLIPYLPLFCDALTSLGTTYKSFSDLDDEIRSCTGGISASVSAHPTPYDINACSIFLIVSGSAMDQNVNQMYDLMQQILTTANWKSLTNLEACLASSATNMASSVTQNGHVFAMRASGASLTRSSKINQTLSGMEQVKFLEGLGKVNVEEISEKLESIANVCFRSHIPSSFVVAGKAVYEAHVYHIRELQKSICTKELSPSSNVIF